MPVQSYLSPNGDLIIGTAETISATALVSGINPDTESRFTKVELTSIGISQKTHTKAGHAIFVCEMGAYWTFDQLVSSDLHAVPGM